MRGAVVGSMVMWAGACGGEDLTPELAAGRDLYAAHCAMCHGERALGDGPMAANLPVPPPSLMQHLGHHTSAQLVGLIKGGVPPAMPPAAITEDEVRLVIDYVWSLVPESEAASLRAMRDQMEAAERARAAGH
jgi:mono/diheme cytochrome c family protein